MKKSTLYLAITRATPSPLIIRKTRSVGWSSLIYSLHTEKAPDFHTQYLCKFIPSQRGIDLHDRLTQYYRDTPDSMGNREAKIHWDLFMQWCGQRGYTQEEINKAKRNVNSEVRL